MIGTYLSGFGNEHLTEAVTGTVPDGRNSPQRAPHGLYAEQLSGTAFTAPRSSNLRTWVYRIRPSAQHPEFRPLASSTLFSAPFTAPFTVQPPNPNRFRWDPLPIPDSGTGFVDGIYTMGGNGDALSHRGIAIHLYAASASMDDRYFVNSDGELLLVPQAGRLVLRTELGTLALPPGWIAVIPRGIRFAVDLPDGPSRGYICENYGAAFVLPERGPIGANGLANSRDFRYPTAAFEDVQRPVQVVQKFGGSLWAADYDHSPLDVVGWHGNYAPYIYDLSKFMAIGTISYDHPDPSIFTVLSSPSTTPGVANADFVIFPPRWLVAEDTFRPPWYHRNVMSEFMGLVRGVYDAKAEGFLPGGASLHNSWSSHGPDAATYARASTAELAPAKLDDTLAFMFETRLPVMLTTQAYDSPHRQRDYDAAWQDIERFFPRP